MTKVIKKKNAEFTIYYYDGQWFEELHLKDLQEDYGFELKPEIIREVTREEMYDYIT